MYTHVYIYIYKYILHIGWTIPQSHPPVLLAHRAARRLDPRALRRVARAVVPGDLQRRRRRAPQQGPGVTEVGHLGMAMDSDQTGDPLPFGM